MRFSTEGGGGRGRQGGGATCWRPAGRAAPGPARGVRPALTPLSGPRCRSAARRRAPRPPPGGALLHSGEKRGPGSIQEGGREGNWKAAPCVAGVRWWFWIPRGKELRDRVRFWGVQHNKHRTLASRWRCLAPSYIGLTHWELVW